MATIIKHGDFGFDTEKVEEIAKNIEVVNNKKAFWGQFCHKMATPVGDKYTARRQILVDPSAVATLNEGGTARLDDIKVVSFSETLNSYGSYIKFTRQVIKQNRDSFLDMARRQLAHNRLYDLESVRAGAFLGTTYTASYATSYWDTLGKLAVRLRKNNAKPYIDGKFALICTPEIGFAISSEARTNGHLLINGSQAGVELAKNGYIGDYAGFHIYTSAYSGLYGSGDASGKEYMLALGMTEDGLAPVVSRFADESNIEVIVHEIGSAGADDPTNEYGTIASRVDNCGAFLEHAECCIKVEITISAVSEDIPTAYSTDQTNATDSTKVDFATPVLTPSGI